MSVSALLAGALSGVLCLCEIFNASRKPPAVRACGWLLVLFGFDFAAGLLSYAILVETLKGLTWFVGLWPIFLAGLCGSALLRSQLALLGSGQEASYHGPAVRYRRLQKQIELKIDRLGAAAQSDWVAKAVPQVERIGVNELDLRVSNYVKALEGIEEKQRQDMLDYFQQTLTDATITDSQKCRYVVQKLVDNECRPCVRSLLRRAKNM
ncbi:hypothetical protein [Nonomuraea insulae]|uniref:Uncharacterized protein n=1 Tax=Nonomuraea insulae TaxID=1616787 RepID=A0ABW1CSX2_9ACTN